MPTGGDRFEVTGDLSPAALADRLGWPQHTVADLIEAGAITRTRSGWLVDPSDLPLRWARAQWDPGTATEEPGPDEEA